VTPCPATLSEAIDTVRRAEVTTRPELTHTRWGVAQELGEPLGPATGRTPPADAPLSPAGHRPGPALAQGLPTPSTTRTPAPHPNTSDAGAPARNAPACNPSQTSSPWSKSTGTASSPGTKTTSATPLLEGINSLIQAAKTRAQGYRNTTKMITIVYLTAAKLQLPTLTHPTPAYMSSR
jgi:hypothetical protein